MILVLVFVGTALASVGVLYFMNIKFCNSPLLAITALVGGVILVLGGEAAVAGASASFLKAQEIRTSVCELEGETAHPRERRDASSKIVFNHIVECMRLSGYDWNDEHPHCREAPLASNPLCYRPHATFARAVTNAQMQFE